MTTRTYTVSEKRALEIAAWARIVDGALKREANRAFWAGEIERATSFLPLIAYTERLAETSARSGRRLARMPTAFHAVRASGFQRMVLSEEEEEEEEEVGERA